MSEFILNQYFIALIMTGIVNLGLALFIIFKGFNKRLNQTAALYSVSIAIWSIFQAFGITSTDESLALLLWRINHVGVIFIPVFLLHFVFTLLKVNEKKRRFIPIAYAVAFVFVIIDATPLLIPEVVPKFSFRFFINPGYFYYFFFSLWVGLAVYVLLELFKEYFRTTGYRRNQMKYFCWSMLVSYIGGVPNFFPTFNLEIPILMPFGTYAVSIYGIATAYAIIRYRLLDINIVVTRTGIFAFVYLFVFGLPFWLGYKCGMWKFSTWIMLFLASLGPFIYNYLRRKAEEIILKEQKRYQKVLKEFSSTLIFIKNEQELAEKVVSEIMSSVKLSFCGVYLKENNNFKLKDFKIEEQGKLKLPENISENSKIVLKLRNAEFSVLGENLPKLDGMSIGMAASLFLKQDFFGFIILGTKKKNEIFTDTDIDIFSILANQTSLSLSEIYYFNEYQKAVEEKYQLEIKMEEERHKIALEKTALEGAFEMSELYRHELGNIIHMISLRLDTIAPSDDYKPSNEEMEKAFSALRENANRGADIFQSLSLYKKNLKAELKEVSLDETLKEAVINNEDRIKQNAIEYQEDIKEGINMKANDNIKEAVKYLIQGAVGAIEYYMPSEKKIEVNLSANDGVARLEITDTGNAVLDDKLYKGVGIERGKEGGLAYFLSRRIIFDHKGTFEIKSAYEGQGSSFIIELPLTHAGE